MYEKWKKKRRREISLGTGHDMVPDRAGGGDDAGPNFKYNTKVKSELKNSNEIRKVRDRRDKNKTKNMKKDKRAFVMKKAKGNGGGGGGGGKR